MPGTQDAPNRIDALFARLHAAGRKALVTFVVAGDPDFEESLATLHAFVESGIDLIEIGYPFSDPILDGATIQRANRRALAAGGSIRDALELVAAFRRTNTSTPIVFMGYANPLLAIGYERFAGLAAQAGVDGIIAADMPLREAGDLLAHLAAAGLRMIPLAAPTLDEADFAERRGVGGFLYCIPVVGPTGGPSASIEAVRLAVERCRRVTSLPVLVGFGIKTPQAAAAIVTVADGAIVGSALIEEVHSGAGSTRERLLICRARAREFRAAIDHATA